MVSKKKSSLTVREATEQDVPVIHDLICQLADYEKMRDEVVSTESDLRTVLFGQRQYAEVLIGEQDATPAGFALFFHNYSTFVGKPGIYLEDLFVRPEYRGKGIGLALLTRIAQIAVERDCGRVEWSVLDWNQPAIDFYQQLGAKPMSEWTLFRLDQKALRAVAAQSAGPV